MKNLLEIFLLLLPVILFIVFWKYAFRRGWRYLELFSATTVLGLSIISFILWVFSKEIYILRVGIGFSLFGGIFLLSLPVTYPQWVEKLNFKVNPSENKKEIFSAVALFLYVIIGPLLLIYLLNPDDISGILGYIKWLLPLAIIISTVSYYRSVTKRK